MTATRSDQPTPRGATRNASTLAARATDLQSPALVQQAGGKARAGSTRLARRLTIGEGLFEVAFKPYRKAAADFRRAQVAHLARTIGGGYVGPGPASMVASAALQLAVSRYIFDRAEHVSASDLGLASRMANESRQNLAMAHELVAKEAKARPQESGLAKLRRDARAHDVQGTATT